MASFVTVQKDTRCLAVAEDVLVVAVQKDTRYLAVAEDMRVVTIDVKLFLG
jgi:hypothetical protein